MEDDNINIMISKNQELIYLIERIIYYFRAQNYDKALRFMTQFIKKFEEQVINFITNKKELLKYGIEIEEKEITCLLQDILTVQEQKDYILLSDLLEVQVKPWLVFIQEKVGRAAEEAFYPQIYQENCKIFIETCKKNSFSMKLIHSLIELGDPTLKEGNYNLEYTASGVWTCAVNKEDKHWYLHSNNSPMMEGFLLAQAWYEESKTDYEIFGLGLGYPVLALFEKSEYIHITVYEYNLDIIRMAFAVNDFRNLFQSGRFHLIYMEKPDKLTKIIMHHPEYIKVVFHEPSIRAVSENSTRELLENYFINLSSIENQLPLLNGNFRINSENNDESIDTLIEAFKGRDLYIIAAGPSLDKNYLLLKDLQKKEETKEKKSIILATGTVFKKLLKAEIRPDYVLVTDANKRVYNQIKGIEQETIPLLYLSTAYYEFAKNYQGKKYIVCQAGYKPAEEFAQKYNFTLFQTGGSVSTTALDIGLSMQCKRIIFLGLDLSFPGGFVHAEGTSRRTLAQEDGLRNVVAVNGEMIKTNRSMDMYRKWIEQRIALEKRIPVIDATEGGAKIAGMKICSMKDLLEEEK